MNNQTVDVLIPVYRPDSEFLNLIEGLKRQSIPPQKIILMHTIPESGTDSFPDFSEYPEVEIHDVLKSEFDHGGTRNAGMRFSAADYVLLLTQDVILYDHMLIENLLKGIREPGAGSCYGRQFPKYNCNALEVRTRSFNYPSESRIQSRETLDTLGIKTYFSPDVCCLYDRKVYLALGGFDCPAIFNEDMVFAWKLIENGYKIVYRADACVYHSHNYTGREQLRRNFDLAVSQADHPEVFGHVSSEKEGIRMVKETSLDFIRTGKPWMIFPLAYQSFMKYAGYFLGKRYKKLPEQMIMKLTMNRDYWRKRNGTDQGNEM